MGLTNTHLTLETHAHKVSRRQGPNVRTQCATKTQGEKIRFFVGVHSLAIPLGIFREVKPRNFNLIPTSSFYERNFILGF